jgi:hypothetical protein
MFVGSLRVRETLLAMFESGNRMLLRLFVLTEIVMMGGLMMMMGGRVLMSGSLMVMFMSRMLRGFCHSAIPPQQSNTGAKRDRK